MVTRLRLRVSFIGVPLAALALAGCALTSRSGNSGMMGSGSQYHSAALTCSAPTTPGRTLRVALGDMGMTQMMSGTAPMRVQMRLQATPTTEPAGPMSLVVSNVGWRTHELVILPLTAGAVAGQRVAGSDGKVSETAASVRFPAAAQAEQARA